VTQMDKVTQSNAANAEESASAAEELSAQAEQLNNMVDELRVLVSGAASKKACAATTMTHKATGEKAHATTHLIHHETTAKAPATAKKKALAHMTADGNGKGKHHGSAEDVIPLSDEKELSRF
jgi:hypothetical protein